MGEGSRASLHRCPLVPLPTLIGTTLPPDRRCLEQALGVAGNPIEPAGIEKELRRGVPAMLRERFCPKANRQRDRSKAIVGRHKLHVILKGYSTPLTVPAAPVNGEGSEVASETSQLDLVET